MAMKVEFVVDEKGRRKSVMMSYRAYLELMEDIADLRTIAERRDEPAEDFDAVLDELRKSGRLPD